MKTEENPKFIAFKEWFERNRAVAPPYDDLCAMFKLSKQTIVRWSAKLGGFKHKRFSAKIFYAKKYLAHNRNRRVSIEELAVEVGYAESTISRDKNCIKRFYEALKAEGIDVELAKDKSSDESLMRFGNRFRNKRGRRPLIKEVASFLQSDLTFARKRVGELLAAYPDAPFALGGELRDEYHDENLRTTECSGARKRIQEWRKWQRRSAPDAYGFAFKGVVWERYLIMWDLRRRGYRWTCNLKNTTMVFEYGRIQKIKTHKTVSYEEAMETPTYD